MLAYCAGAVIDRRKRYVFEQIKPSLEANENNFECFMNQSTYFVPGIGDGTIDSHGFRTALPHDKRVPNI